MQPMTDTEALDRISRNLRQRRNELGISLAEVSRRAGTYPTTIKQVEDGERMPGAGLLTRIADAIGMTVTDMLERRREKVS